MKSPLSENDVLRIIEANLVAVAPDWDATSDRPLVGENALLDSASLISLLIGIEESLQTECDAAIMLMGDDGAAPPESALASAGTLAKFVADKLATHS